MIIGHQRRQTPLRSSVAPCVGVSAGFSLVELMVALTIVGVVVVGTYSGFKSFSNAVSVVTEENVALEDVSVAADLLRRDLQMAGWGLPTAGRLASDEAGGIDVTEATFSVDIDGDGSADDTMHTDRLFIADGLKIVTDSAPYSSGGYYPDGVVPKATMLAIADAEAIGGQKASLVTATGAAGSVRVSSTNVNYDTESDIGWYSGYNCVDIVDNGAVIVAGNTTGGSYAVEGHRIGSAPTLSSNQKKCNGVSGSQRPGATTLTFVSGETLGTSYSLDSASIAVPAVAWYVKQASDNVYWLYRNENKVLANVVDFQVAFGIDVDQDGLEWAATVAPSTSGALWTRPEHTLAYLASDDPAYPKANSSGEVINHARPREVIESVRTVWFKITLLRRTAAEEDDEDNIIASAYTTMVNLRN